MSDRRRFTPSLTLPAAKIPLNYSRNHCHNCGTIDGGIVRVLQAARQVNHEPSRPRCRHRSSFSFRPAAFPQRKQPRPTRRSSNSCKKPQKLLNDKKKTDDAVTVLKKVVKLAPADDKMLAVLSDLERQTGKFADGAEHAMQAIKINDKVPTYYLLVAINAYNMHDLDRAREYCDKVLKRGEKRGRARRRSRTPARSRTCSTSRPTRSPGPSTPRRVD